MADSSVYFRGLLVILAGTQLFLKCYGEPCEALKAEQEDQTNRTGPHLDIVGLQKQSSVRQDSLTHYYPPLKGMKTP